MQANSNVMGDKVLGVPLDWGETRSKAKSLQITKKLADAGISVAGVGAFIALLGVVEFALYRAMEGWSISGVGVTVFGYF